MPTQELKLTSKNMDTISVCLSVHFLIFGIKLKLLYIVIHNDKNGK